MKHRSGNGSGRFNVVQKDMGGWVRVYPDRTAGLPEDLPVYLPHALTQWFRDRPQLRMRQVVPIQRDGNAIELHAWFDLGVFPDLSGQNPQKVE